MTKWWHRWRARVWEFRWLECHGRMLDIEKGVGGITWKMAVWDRERAERNCAYHRARINRVIDRSASDA